jgi:hypothetical protein
MKHNTTDTTIKPRPAGTEFARHTLCGMRLNQRSCMLIDQPQKKKKKKAGHGTARSPRLSRENNSCPSHFSPTKASNPLPHKGFRDLRN